MRMRQGLAGLTLAAATIFAGGYAPAEGADPAPKCFMAEVNPVTGHLLCLDPPRRAGRSAARGGASLQA